MLSSLFKSKKGSSKQQPPASEPDKGDPFDLTAKIGQNLLDKAPELQRKPFYKNEMP